MGWTLLCLVLYSSNSKTYSRTCSIERTTYAWLALVRCARLHLSPQGNHLACFPFAWTTSSGALGRIHTGHLQDHNSYTSANSSKFKQTNILLFKLFSKNDWGWFRRAPHFYARYPASLSALLVASLSKAACGDIRHFSESQPWNFFESSKCKTCNLSVLQSYQSSIAAWNLPTWQRRCRTKGCQTAQQQCSKPLSSACERYSGINTLHWGVWTLNIFQSFPFWDGVVKTAHQLLIHHRG